MEGPEVPREDSLLEKRALWQEIPQHIRLPLAQALDFARGAYFIYPYTGSAERNLAYEREFDSMLSYNLSIIRKRGPISWLDDPSDQYSLHPPDSPTHKIMEYVRENPDDNELMNMLWDNL